MNQRLRKSLPVGFLLVWLLPHWLLGQQIRLGDVPQTLCAGASVPVSFTVSGSFPAGNTFSLELADQYNQVVATETDNVGPTGSFMRIPATLTPNPTRYRIRVVASSTGGASNDVPIQFNGVPSAVLRAAANTTDQSVNPGDALAAEVALLGGGPYSLRFTDGSSYELDDAGLRTLLLYPNQTKTYQLASITNQCGTGRVSGAIPVTVRSAGLLVTRLSTTDVCAGKPVEVFFSADRPLAANTVFKVDLQPLTPQAPAYTLTATGNTSPVRVQLPADAGVGGTYLLRLYSDNANLSAYYRNQLGDRATYVQVRPAPRIQLTGGATIGFGQTAQLTVSGAGVGNGSVTLSDGTVVPLTGDDESGPRQLPISPAQTTTYSVRSVSNGCGFFGAEAGTGTATVTVQPGYRIDSLSSLSVCAGQSMQVFFTTNEPLSTEVSSYQFRGGTVVSNNQLGGGLIDLVVQQVAAGRQPNTGVLTVTPRPLPADYLTNAGYGPAGQLGAGRFYCQLSRNGQAGNVYDQPLSVADKPLLLLDERPFTLNRPQPISLPARLVSQAPGTEVVLSDGTRLTVRGEVDYGRKNNVVLLEAVATQSGTFRVATVQNSCGVGTAQGSVAVQVRSDTALLAMHPIPARLCAGAPVSVSFVTAGNAGIMGTYRVEITDDSGLFAGRYLASGTSSPITVTIPGGYTLYNRLQLRVVANPASGTALQTSAAREFMYLDAAQVVRLSAAETGSTETAIRSGETVRLRLLSGDSPVATPTRVTLSDGQVVAFDAVSADVPVRPAQTTTYTIRAAQNSCGAVAGVGTVTVRVQPFQMQALLPKRVYCEGDSLQAQLLVQGTLPAQATHALQVLLNGNVVQTLPARLADHRLTAGLPTSLSANTAYAVRILTTVGADQVYSLPSTTTFRTYRQPRLQLTPPDNQTAVVLEARQNALTVQLTNPNEPAGLLLSRYYYRINEQAYASVDNLPVSVPLYAIGAAPTSYSVSAVYDAYCGFGTAAGAVRVSYKPGLRSVAVNKTQFCRGSDQVVVNYEVAGDFSPDTRFSLYLTNAAGVRTRVGESARQVDRIAFAIDSTLAPGTYQLSLSLPAGLSAADGLPAITVSDRPTVVIAGGSSAQYADQSLTVGLRVVSGMLPVSVTLTNGTVQTLFSTDTPLTISPQQNETYRIVRAENSCGVGRTGGVVSVTVLPAAAQEIRVTTVRPQGNVTAVCQGGAIQVGLSLKGTFAADNRFTIFLSDSTGQQYQPLRTQVLDATATTALLTAPLPASAVPGAGYRVRIGASNPDVLGASSSSFLTILPALQATISGTTTTLRGELTPVVITLTNTGPWSVSLNNSLYGLETATINESPFLYRVRPEATITYTLLGVYNQQCGNGRVNGQAVLTTTDPLAIDPMVPVQVRVLPNPTQGQVRVEGTLPVAQPVRIRLTTLTGQLLQLHSPGLLRDVKQDLDLSAYAAGVYLLTLEADDRRTVFKIIKE